MALTDGGRRSKITNSNHIYFICGFSTNIENITDNGPQSYLLKLFHHEVYPECAQELTVSKIEMGHNYKFIRVDIASFSVLK